MKNKEMGGRMSRIVKNEVNPPAQQGSSEGVQIGETIKVVKRETKPGVTSSVQVGFERNVQINSPIKVGDPLMAPDGSDGEIIVKMYPEGDNLVVETKLSVYVLSKVK